MVRKTCVHIVSYTDWVKTTAIVHFLFLLFILVSFFTSVNNYGGLIKKVLELIFTPYTVLRALRYFSTTRTKHDNCSIHLQNGDLDSGPYLSIYKTFFQ